MNLNEILKITAAGILSFGLITPVASQSKTQTDESNQFTVINVTPQGELPASVKYPAIQIQFSEPVIALAELGKPTSMSDIVEITPKLNGTFRWKGTSILSFESSDEVIAQKVYTVRINKNTKSKKGTLISGNLSYTFHTEELKISSIRPAFEETVKGTYINTSSVPLQAAQDIGVFFNAPVSCPIVKNYISVKDGNGNKLSFSAAQENKNCIRIFLSDTPPEDTDIIVTLNKGAMADNDCYQTTQDRSKQFHTLIKFTAQKMYTDTSNTAEDKGFPVYIPFSSSLKQNSEEEIARFISTDITSQTITKDNLSVSGQTLIISHLNVKHDQQYSITISKNLKDIYERELDKDYTYKVTVPSVQSYALFQNRGFKAMESSDSPSITFYHQNIKAGSTYTIKSLTDADGTQSKNNSKEFSLDTAKIEQDKLIKETVDLRPFLEQVKTDSGTKFRGTVQFNALIKYKQMNEVVPATLENNQILQVTDLGITVRYCYNKAIVLVTDLKTGKPVSNATVKAYISKSQGAEKDKAYQILHPEKGAIIASNTTGKDGLTTIDFDKKQTALLDTNGIIYFEAKTKNDRIIYVPNDYYYTPWGGLRYASDSEISPETESPKSMVSFIFSDRKLYKPGETVTISVIDRNLLRNGTYEIPSNQEAKYTISISENGWNKSKVYCSDSGMLSSAGTASASLTLPQDIKPGYYSIVFKRKCDSQENQQTEQINVQFFERLRFEAKTEIPQLTYIKGDNINATVSASYLGGGSLAGAAYRTFWQANNSYFYPKSDDFADMSFSPIDYSYNSNSFENVNGTLDDDGKAVSSHNTRDDNFSSRPMTYTATTQITDSGNQSIQTNASVLVHPAKFYIGIRKDKAEKGFAKKGESSSFVYTVITPDETKAAKNVLPKDNELKMELIYEEWTRIQEINSRGVISYRYERKFTTEDTRKLSIPSSTKPVSFKVTPKNGGAYKIRLSAEDSDGNSVISEKSFYSISSDWYYRGNNGEQITLQPDKNEYHIGDKAQILMQTELPKGKYLVCVERDSIKSAKIIDIDAPTSVIEIPIEESYVPVVYVSVSTYSDRITNPEQTPKSYFGVTTLNISTQSKTFDIEITPDQKNYQPGDKVQINLRATKDAKAVPDAHLFVQVTDRSILDLINYHVSNPVNFFYSQYRFSNQAYGGDSRSLLVMEEQESQQFMELKREALLFKTYESGSAAKNKMCDLAMTDVISSEGEPDAEGEEPKIRKNFDATAFYSADIITDKKGTAKVSFTLPDSLTAYRITVVGVKDDTFGESEHEINAVQPISARTVLPRKLRLDDKGELGLTISNLTSKPGSVDVSLEIYDGLDKAGITNDENEIQKLPGKAQVLDKAQKNIKVAADKTGALMFYIKAEEPGWITAVFTLKGKNINEKIVMPLEIEKPYIFETVTTIGSTEDSAHETVILPSSADAGRGKLYVQLDPTKLGVLKEAVSYVFHYPYGCMEQRSAAVLPLVAFGDYIKIFGLESEVLYPKGVAEGEIRTWANVQLADGGFPYWPGKTESSLYVSMRIAEIAAIAKENNIPTGSIKLQNLSDYLIKEADALMEQYPDSPWSLYTASYAYYSAQLIGGNVSKSSLARIAENDSSDVDTLAFTALTYLAKGEISKAKELSDKLRAFTRLTARGIDITSKTPNHYWCFFNSESENYALYLQLFTKLNSKDSINQHLVYELLKLQKAGNGYWKSTAATARVLIALNDYIKENNLENLNFTASVLLSGKELLTSSFKGVDALAKDAELDFTGGILKKFDKDRELDLEFTKTGSGTLYYTASMSYAIPVSRQTARDEGICVYTEIYDAETGERVDGNKLTSGRMYREKVYLSSTINCEYVAVRVPVPAGCEILNDAFVTTLSVPPSQDDVPAKKAYYNSWYYNGNRGLSNKAIYDDEIQYFWNYFPRGNQDIEFVFRANRKGEYHTPCVTASCMYEEEIFGRSNGKVWTIE